MTLSDVINVTENGGRVPSQVSVPPSDSASQSPGTKELQFSQETEIHCFFVSDCELTANYAAQYFFFFRWINICVRLLCWNSLIGSRTATNKNDSESVLGRSQTIYVQAPSDVCGQTLSQRTGDVEEVFSPNMLSGCTLIAVYGPIKVRLQGRLRQATESWNVRNLRRKPAWAGSEIPCS